MARREEGSDSDAPEEFTSEQGIQLEEEITKVQRENKASYMNCNFPTNFDKGRRSMSQNSSYLPNGIPSSLSRLHSHVVSLHWSQHPWIVREGKERRRKWAQRITARPSRVVKSIQNEMETPQEPDHNGGMLPDDIVKLIAAQEKKVFLSDSEQEKTEEGHASRKKKPKRSGLEPVILKELPPPQCLQNSLEFLKKRKMQVARSSAVLKNSNQALRLISTSFLSKK